MAQAGKGKLNYRCPSCFMRDLDMDMFYDKEKDEFFYYRHKKQSRSYHGTGDIFSSTFIGAMMRGKTYKEAIKIAADYTSECIRLTILDKSTPWYGVNFEEAIPFLLDSLK